LSWSLTKKGTLLIPSGTSHNPDKKHLFVVCALNDSDAMLASIATWINHLCDGTCILEAGEHPFITAKSYIIYRKCRIEKCQTLIKGVHEGLLIPREPVKDEPFARICDGIVKSKQTPWKMKQAFKKWK
jgi:hypothetical protein